MTDDLIGAYDETRSPFWRTAGEDAARLGRARNHVPILLEVDVTAARAALARRKQQGGADVSFTAWACKCIAQAAAQHPRVHAVRGRAGLGGGLAARIPLGPHTIVTFADVDMTLAVYRRLTGDESGERLPMPFVVRKVNEKGLEELNDEIRAAQSRPLPEDQQWLDPEADVPPPWLIRLGFAAPAWLRDRLYWDRLLGDPLRVKRTMGTVMVTSLPLTTKSGGAAWGIPSGIHPLLVALGAVGRRAGLAAGGEDDAAAGAMRFEPRDVLSMTVLFDHDVVDGLPVALFLRRLAELMESAFGL
jgi:pyruvate/2-oxoglutarate dehydrogenase complex dihydrolipoamide acyltransferase (E2) component